MINYFSLLFSILVYLISLPALGNMQDRYYFRSLEVEDGLSQSSVYSILQDKQGFMWFGTQDGLNRYDGNQFKVFKHETNSSQSLTSNIVLCMMHDDDDDDDIIWIATTNGVSLYNPRYETFTRLDLKTDKGEYIEGKIRDIKKDKNNNVWITSIDKGIYRINPDKKLTFFPLYMGKKGKRIDAVAIEFDRNNNLWLASTQGLYKFNTVSGQTEEFLIDNHNSINNAINDLYLLDNESLLVATSSFGVKKFNLKTAKFTPFLEKDFNGNPLFVRKLLRSETGELWIGTEKGLFIYNLQTKEIANIKHINNDPYALSDNAIHSIYQDREGGIWIGTYFGGVNYYIDSYSQFDKYYPINGENSISGKSISEFCQDSKKDIWIGTEDAGLNKFNPTTRIFSSGFLPATNIHSLMIDQNNLWVGSFTEGLYVININTNRYKTYTNSQDPNSLDNNSIYSIYKDYSGTIWIGTMTGLHTYNAQKDNFNRIKKDTIKHQINDIVEDHKGILWFASLGDGLFSFDRYNHNWKHYSSISKDNNFSGKIISCVLRTSRQQLWIGTEGAGICMYDYKTDSFINHYSTNNGLPNDVVYQLLEDEEGNIWGSTNKGLFKLNIENKNILIYNHDNGLQGDQFNYKSGFVADDGKVYFGGIKGFVAFHPHNLRANRIVPPVVINDFHVYGDETFKLEESITHTTEINIPHTISAFSLGVAALSFQAPQGNKYAFQLVGRDQDWIYTNQLYKISYSDLAAGEYVFRVKAANSDGVWNEEGATLKINILPPFYRTILAYIIYTILILGIMYYIIMSYTKKIARKNKRELEKLEQVKEKELYDAKIAFFTNITHEIRTPISLIKSPLDEIIKNIEDNSKQKENLNIIQRNTDRLLKLVNELLDFRKVETKGLKLNLTLADIFAIIKNITTEFKPSIELKNIKLETEYFDDSYYMNIDIEIFSKIMNNLLSNALKHAKNSIILRVSLTDEYLSISISNDGKRIPKVYAQKIFEPFFKLDENTQGSGIGLSFTKSLIELSHGELFLDENDTDFTTFVVKLPIVENESIKQNDPIIDPSELDADMDLEQIEEIIKPNNKRTILLVEDNEDFLNFTTNLLKVDYNIIQARNGQEALDILDEENVNIIISDIMMPVMEGMELCRRIKENIKYSHIPVILLTAKNTLQSKIDGMKIGADEYIIKPFSIDYLKARIENLIEVRKKIRDSYKESPELNYDTIVHSKADENFLNKLIAIIHANIDKVDLDVDMLALNMNMSRATFYRKVKSISELTPNDFIRLIRLKKAAELLKQKDYRINEIAFIAGFSSSSYFSKCFYKQFGILPKDFYKSNEE